MIVVGMNEFYSNEKLKRHGDYHLVEKRKREIYIESERES